MRQTPRGLEGEVPENQPSWTTFAQAIKNVNMGHICEGVRKYKEKIASDTQMKADISYLKQ